MSSTDNDASQQKDGTSGATVTSKEIQDDTILYREVRAVKSGQIERFEINYSPLRDEHFLLTKSLWVKVRNIEPLAMRAAFIAGPYILYVDCRSEDFSTRKKCFVTADQPSYDSQLQPGKWFIAELSCHTIKDTYKWTVDVVSQMIFNSNIDINFEVLVGTSKQVLLDANVPENKVLHSDRTGVFVDPSLLHVHNLDTYDLWNIPVPPPEKNIHLVILTHGLHSNVSADMFYLKEQIDLCSSGSSDNLVVKGFFGNICKTERGIKYLGSRVAEYAVGLVEKNELLRGKVTKISFVGHSLGGLVQTFAIGYLQINFPWFFKKIKPVNFITLASPLLGASNENPIYVSLALLAGIVGKTGQDLSLRFLEDSAKPLLLLLPSGPTHTILKKFVRRTVYANVANDGVVPLRTSGLLYLDHEGLGTVLNKKEIESHTHTGAKVDKIPEDDLVEQPLSFLPQPMQMILSKFMPQKQKAAPAEVAEVAEEPTNILKRIEGLPQSSVIETAQSLILPPLPPQSYIVNPEERANAIVYDKVYHEEDLPSQDDEDKEIEDPQASSPDNKFKQLMSKIDPHEFERIEEEIAREYHRGMSWRKVLVKLAPDAHNNIIVRRRFANAYGWPVIEHLIDNHFNVDAEEERDIIKKHWNTNGLGLMDNDSQSSNIELVDILSRDLIKKENQTIEEQIKDEHKWINTKDAENFFTVGPAGLISDVSALVANLRDQWYNSQNSKLLLQEKIEVKQTVNDEYEDELQVKRQVMGDFI